MSTNILGNNRHTLIGVVIVVLLSAGLLSTQYMNSGTENKPFEVIGTAQLVDTSPSVGVAVPPLEKHPALPLEEKEASQNEIDLLIEELASILIQEHSGQKHKPSFQVTLKEMRDDLMMSYPGQGEDIFKRILTMAFPELVSEILALLAKLDIYDQWLLNNMLDLNELPALQQQGMIWQKRYEIFGEELAEAIWEVERSAEEDKRESMMTTVNMLNHSDEMSMQDRIFLLQSAYDENYFGSVEDLVLDSKGMLSQVVFGLDVVQKELSQMSPALRQAEIDDVRRLIGFEESQIEWLSKRDQEREARWNNGLAYMDERLALVEQYEGEILQEQLDILRDKYFKHEASTIKKEEEMLGFFRFTRERVYGRN